MQTYSHLAVLDPYFRDLVAGPNLVRPDAEPNSVAGAKAMIRTMMGILLLLAVASSGLADDPVSAEHFEKHIRPVLIESCIQCHGEKKQEGGLRLDSRQSILDGGDSGPAIVPGNSDTSLLVEAIKHESFEMPPDGTLTDGQIRHFEAWINSGATWPEHSASLRAGPKKITEADRQWWAFQPVPAVEPPEARDPWIISPIDAFVIEAMNQHQLHPAPPASDARRLRRLYFDLIGIPPTPEQIEAFVNDDSPDAWEKQIDALLADRRYGEHWARFWLDVVRYAESDGWNQDKYRDTIWKYRDYVVRSFNEDKPWPEFVREQLAGDELDGDDPQHLVAAGFLRLGIYEYNQRDARGQWDDIMNELTDVAGDVFLGMSMACARCHDHKFDPILQDDYYRLRAFFEPLIWEDEIPEADTKTRQAHQRQLKIWQQKTADIQQDIDDLLQPYHDRKWESTVDKFPLDIQACFHKPVEQRNSWEHQMAYLVSRQFEEEGGGPLKDMTKADKERYEALKKELAAFDEYRPRPLPGMMTVKDFPGPASPTINPDDASATPIQPGYLTVVCNDQSPDADCQPTRSSSGRRLALANWIGSEKNGLTNRVIVNRIWQQHFGQGLVATPNDFGAKGARPTHPELLDWLTSQFIASGGSFKQLHKTILMSSTWQQSTYHPDAERFQEVDPQENWLWRSRVRRLNAEQIRDAMLACSGELSDRLGGPSVDVKQPRRSLYVKRLRNTPDGVLGSFDVANGLKSVAVRDVTTTPTQALMMINGDFVLARAAKFAGRVKASGDSANDIVEQAVFVAWGRPATDAERQQALLFLDVAADAKANEIKMEKLIDFCHVLLNSNEFLYVD